LYEVLGLALDCEVTEVKKSYRKLSISHHPDKGGDPNVFNDIREAYETLSDPDKRHQYDAGGILLVKNVEMGLKEFEGQEAQSMAQLDQQIPKNHPMRKQAEAQIMAQIPSKEQAQRQVKEKMSGDEVEIKVPTTLEQLYNGVVDFSHEFERLSICRGCRADPEAPQCKDCGKCPPEKRQIPKMGPIPGMVIGMKEEEVESKERCKKVKVPMSGLKIPKGAKEGSILKRVIGMGHQTPGRFPGNLLLKLSRVEHDLFTVVEDDLYTTLNLTLEEVVFGFSQDIQYLDGTKVKS